MKLIKEDFFPTLIDSLLRIFSAQGFIERGEEFNVLIQQLTFSVKPFVFGHGSIGALMVFQEYFPHPFGQVGISCNRLFQHAEILPCGSHFHSGTAGNPLCKSFGIFQHSDVRTAAPVSITIGYEYIIVNMLLLISLPGSHNLGRIQNTVISGSKGIIFFLKILRCYEMG